MQSVCQLYSAEATAKNTNCNTLLKKHSIKKRFLCVEATRNISSILSELTKLAFIQQHEINSHQRPSIILNATNIGSGHIHCLFFPLVPFDCGIKWFWLYANNYRIINQLSSHNEPKWVLMKLRSDAGL